MEAPKHIPLPDFREYAPDEMRERSAAFLADLRRRRSVRDFSDRAIPDGVIEDCLLSAGSAPSGANQQPWHFAVVRSPAVKREIRLAAEMEEREFYDGRATEAWLRDLAPIGTDAEKPFLESAPCLIAIFAQSHGAGPGGNRRRHYYVKESVGIATGFLIAALHNAGLATLTHTPSPMGFLNRILNRPSDEKPFLLLVTGFPSLGAVVPAIEKKGLRDIATFF
jgi:nitroreductase